MDLLLSCGSRVQNLHSKSSTPTPFTEKISMCKLNAATYVGGTCSSAWGGRDIGAQINAAYRGLFPLGGTIYVLPQTGGGCYSFSTPIAFSTAGEYAILEGLTSTNRKPSAGASLNFTSVKEGAAITLDYTPGTGGGYGAAGGLRDLTLIGHFGQAGIVPKYRVGQSLRLRTATWTIECGRGRTIAKVCCPSSIYRDAHPTQSADRTH